MQNNINALLLYIVLILYGPYEGQRSHEKRNVQTQSEIYTFSLVISGVLAEATQVCELFLSPPTTGGFIIVDGDTFKVKGNWESKDHGPTPVGYDFWYQPRQNVMISSEWGAPNCFTKGFNPAHVAEGKYGKFLHVWDWTERKVIQDIDLGNEGWIPLELRFLHDPMATEGYVGAALSSNIIYFYKKEVG